MHKIQDQNTSKELQILQKFSKGEDDIPSSWTLAHGVRCVKCTDLHLCLRWYLGHIFPLSHRAGITVLSDVFNESHSHEENFECKDFKQNVAIFRKNLHLFLIQKMLISGLLMKV